MVLALLADRRVNINQSITDFRFTPLMTASSNGRLEIVKLFLRCPKTDVTYIGIENMDALDWAIHMGHMDVVRAIESVVRTKSRSSYQSQGSTCPN